MVSCNEPLPELPEKYKLKDSRYTKIEGQVLEYGSNKPLVGAEVFLQEAIYAPFSGGGNYITIDTFYTDNEGKYSIEFLHLPSTDSYNVSYQVEAHSFWYYPETKSMETGYGHRRNIILDPFGWIKVHLKNVNPFDNKDYLFTSIEGGGGHYYGKEIDLIDIRTRNANKKIGLYWTVKKNNILKEYNDSLYLPAHDTVNYEILY